ncbi:MAG: class I SAM-dependent methyltransferase [bacterium]|nr:class I SAM-dependent methyltransferase [bacterium]
MQLDNDQLLRYLALVEQYSVALNLTAFRGAAELALELGAESLRLLELGEIATGWNCVDLGSGVGTPVVPLALAVPLAQFTAVEARARRCDFMRMVVAQVHIDNLVVLEQRTEQLIADAPHTFDLVTARAYAAPDVLCAHAAALLKLGGELRGYSGAEMVEVECATAAHRFILERVLPYDVGDSHRHVYLLRKGGV